MPNAELIQLDVEEAAAEAQASGLRFAPFAIHVAAPERPGPAPKGASETKTERQKSIACVNRP